YYTVEMTSDLEKLIVGMKNNPKGVRFADLCKVCDHFFGAARQSGSSHCIYKTPWQGDPRVNIQNDHGKAKSYQVRQVMRAIERLQDAQKKEESDNAR
ncbi:hypothetical protein WDW86_18985, partial [Bdellovibrionota bacterium FG-2]